MDPNARFWDGIAESYAAKPVDDPDAFERKIAATLERMRPDHVVLDVGCGTGSLALRLAPSAFHVHGLDASAEMVRIAEAKAADAGVDTVTFHHGGFDDTFTAFAPGTLDGLCAYSLLHLVKDRKAALARAFSLLRPGGFFVSSTVCLGGSWIPYGPMLWAMRLVGKAPWVGIVRPEALIADLEAAGFVDVERPDVGAASDIVFLIARKPDGTGQGGDSVPEGTRR